MIGRDDTTHSLFIMKAIPAEELCERLVFIALLYHRHMAFKHSPIWMVPEITCHPHHEGGGADSLNESPSVSGGP